MHRDGFTQDSFGNRSALTIEIFLNEDFKGGDTNFYHEDMQTVKHQVKPKIGKGIIFDPLTYESEETVKEGVKYVLRTDVMVSARR